MKDFEIFSTGTHTASNGVTKTYTEDDLDHIVEKYNTSDHTAPIVIGHPKSNAPAWGWIDKVYRKGKTIFAKPKDLVKDFVDAVKEKKFLKRSISLTPDGLLNHVGFLGAAVPAVKGLADVEFNAEDDLLDFEIDSETLQEEIEQDEEAAEQNDKAENSDSLPPENKNGADDQKNFLDNLTNSLSDAISELQEYLSLAKNNSEFQSDTDEELKQLQDRMSDLRTKIDIANFELLLNEKVSYGYLTPAMKAKVLDILKYFSNLNYSETDSSSLTSDIQNMFLDFLESTPKYLEFEEVATKEEVETKPDDPSFDDFDLDPESSALHSDILALSNKENISYEEAFQILVNQKKS